MSESHWIILLRILYIIYKFEIGLWWIRVFEITKYIYISKRKLTTICTFVIIDQQVHLVKLDGTENVWTKKSKIQKEKKKKIEEEERHRLFTLLLGHSKYSKFTFGLKHVNYLSHHWKSMFKMFTTILDVLTHALTYYND